MIRRKREAEEAAIAAAKQAAAEKWEAVQQRFGLVRRSLIYASANSSIYSHAVW